MPKPQKPFACFTASGAAVATASSVLRSPARAARKSARRAALNDGTGMEDLPFNILIKKAAERLSDSSAHEFSQALTAQALYFFSSFAGFAFAFSVLAGAAGLASFFASFWAPPSTAFFFSDLLTGPVAFSPSFKPFTSAMPAKRFLNLDSWPPRSTSLEMPVQAGWVLGSISRRMVSPALPQVERVSNSVPSVMMTLIGWYSGWIFSFMGRVYRGGAGTGARG